MERVTDLADPRRCKGACPTGQCHNLAVEGSDFCLAHGGQNTRPREYTRQYLLARTQDQMRLAQLEEDENYKTLRDEVIIATGLLQRRLDLAQSDADFIAAFPQIERFLKTLTELKKARQILDDRAGSMLSRSTLLRVAQEICRILIEQLEGVPNYERIVDELIVQIMSTVKNALNTESKSTV